MAGGPLFDYEWILVLGAIAALFAAFGIGANDVANAWATSVGSKALTIRQASALALVFEALGAVSAGSAVAETFRKGIADPKCFEDNRNDAALLIYGNLCVVITVGFWLLIATKYEMPVSTTHTAVGGMIGMAMVLKGSGCVIWEKASGGDRLYIPQGVAGIVASWMFSPFLSMFFAMVLFSTVRKTILRTRQAYKRAIAFYPILVFIAVMINSFFIISKGLTKKICPQKTTEDWLCSEGKVVGVTAFWLSIIVALVVTVAITPVYFKIGGWAKAYVARSHHNEAEKQDKKSIAMNPLARSTSYHSALSDEGVPTKTDVALAEVPMTRWGKFIHFLKTHPDVDVHSTGKEVAVVAEIHENAEEFDETAEAVFRYIQVFTAVCDSFAHGANDVANAMGPFMSIYIIYHNGEVSKKSDTSNDSYWILALGGIGMGVGLFIYGYKIIRAIGIKLAKVTPSRGFAIELGAAIVIIIGSYLGIPLSTTHCQVGATVGVGLLEGKGGVNKRTLGITVLGWVLTLLVAGLGAAMLTAQGVYAPSIERLHQCPAV